MQSILVPYFSHITYNFSKKRGSRLAHVEVKDEADHMFLLFLNSQLGTFFFKNVVLLVCCMMLQRETSSLLYLVMVSSAYEEEECIYVPHARWPISIGQGVAM